MRAYVALPQQEPVSEMSAALVAGVVAAGHALVNDPLEARRIFPLAQAERAEFAQAFDRMMEADLVVADVSAPDHGVGWAVAWFLAKGRLVVLCCKRSAREGLSPLLAGNPSPWCKLVVYDGAHDLSRALATALAPND